MMRCPLRYRHHANKIDVFTARKYAGTLMNIMFCIFGPSSPRMPKP